VDSAFAYLRVSGLSQADGDGFPRQFAACEHFAAKNDLKIVVSYPERGVTGKSELDNRPALRACIDALLANGTRILLIEKLDRLARDLMIQESIVQDLQRKGITLISVSEPDLFSADPTRTVIRQILGAFFQYERAMITSKLKAARERIKEQGRAPGAKNYSPDPALNKNAEGRKPYGQKPGEAEPLRMILAWHRANVACGSIAANLNSAGIPSRRGKSWRASVVAKILARERQKAA
jgi:DNA invertase Pin-like site-specific DNA recombinase